MAHKVAKQLEESASKRPKRAASAAQQAITAAASASAPDKWSADNEVLLLESFLRISEDRGVKPTYEQIYEAMQGCIPDNFSSKDRVGTKLRHLKRKFLRAHAAASPPLDDLVYQLSEKIWGGDAAGAAEEETAGGEAEADVAASKPKLKRKRKTKSTSAVAAADVQLQQQLQEGEGTTVDKDTGGARRSPRGHSDVNALKKMKAKSKSKSNRHELVSAEHPSTAIQLELLHDDSSMLSGLVRILQQTYSDADEKSVRMILKNMDGRHVDEIKKDWQKLQLLKLEVASLTTHMAWELVGALRQKARAAAGVVSGG